MIRYHIKILYLNIWQRPSGSCQCGAHGVLGNAGAVADLDRGEVGAEREECGECTRVDLCVCIYVCMYVCV